MEGYKGTKPDFGWWEAQITAGIAHRKRLTSEAQWNTWREYYRGEWNSDILPMNLFFTMMRTVVPRIYFRNPGIAIRPGKPGPEHAIFAKILERIDNKLMTQMKIKASMRKMIGETWRFGTTFGKVGFGSMFDTRVDFDSAPTEGKKNERLEYNSNVKAKFPAFWRTSPGDVVLPAGLREFDESRWIAHVIERPLADVKADKRLANRGNVGAAREDLKSLNDPDGARVPMATLWEIRDKKTGEVFVLAKDAGSDKHTLHQEEDFFLNTSGRFPIFPLVFNTDDEFFWGTPDSRILEPYQLEINEIKTQIMYHRRFATKKILARAGTLSDTEALKLVDESIMPVIFTNTDPSRDIKELNSQNIPPELRIVAQDVLQDVRESIGFGRNQFGEFNPGSSDTTATEANIVRMASEIRIDERRDIVADLLGDVFVQGIHEVIFAMWTDEVVELVGPGGLPVWVTFTGTELARSSFNVDIDPDTSLPETRAVREQRAAQIFQLLAPNPLIDPVALTKHLLNSFHGVQFDNLMKELPPPPAGTVNGPLNPQQFGQMVSQRVAARNP